MSAEAGKIFHEYTSVEISEDGVIWLIQNHFENPSVINEMESTSKGEVIIDSGWVYEDEDLGYDEELDEYL